MLLLVDHLALRARCYEYLIRLFQEWEVSVCVGARTHLFAFASADSVCSRVGL